MGDAYSFKVQKIRWTKFNDTFNRKFNDKNKDYLQKELFGNTVNTFMKIFKRQYYNGTWLFKADVLKIYNALYHNMDDIQTTHYTINKNTLFYSSLAWFSKEIPLFTNFSWIF